MSSCGWSCAQLQGKRRRKELIESQGFDSTASVGSDEAAMRARSDSGCISTVLHYLLRDADS